MILLSAVFSASTSLLSGQIYADLDLCQGNEGEERSLGIVRIRLEYEESPRAVANFIGLATGARSWIDPETGKVNTGVPYYDGLTFHKLEHGSAIEGGDRRGLGFFGPLANGLPGYVFPDEPNESLSHDGPYVVSLVNHGLNTNGAMFRVTTEVPMPDWDQTSSIFGTVVDSGTLRSREIVRGFRSEQSFPVNFRGNPEEPIVMRTVTIVDEGNHDFDVTEAGADLPIVCDYPLDLFQTGDHRRPFGFRINAKPQIDYIVYQGTGLTSFFRGAHYMRFGSMDLEEPTFNLSNTRSFFRGAAVDYSATPQAPPLMTLASSDAKVVLEGWNSDDLVVVFSGPSAGSWSMHAPDRSETKGRGLFQSLSFIDKPTSFPLLPKNGFLVAGSGIVTHGRYLSVLAFEVTLPEGQNIPGFLNGLQVERFVTELGFHRASQGWYKVTPNGLENAALRGTFRWVPPGQAP